MRLIPLSLGISLRRSHSWREKTTGAIFEFQDGSRINIQDIIILVCAYATAHKSDAAANIRMVLNILILLQVQYYFDIGAMSGSSKVLTVAILYI